MQFTRIVQALFIVLAFTQCAAIYNGWVAQEDELMRSFVHFGYKDNRNGRDWRCGGVLITWKHVLTAAHCEVDPRDDVAYVGVSRAHDRSNIEGYMFEVERVHVHPQYDDDTVHHDIAIVRLKWPSATLLRASGVVPATIKWHVSEWGQMSYDFRIMGLGHTEHSTSAMLPSRLMYGDAHTTHPNYCANKLGASPDPTQTICFDGTRGSVTCRGDSGGPVVYWSVDRWVVVGLVSSGEHGREHCLPGETWKATNVEHYKQWIIDITDY